MWGKAPLDLRCPAPAIATRQGGDRLRAPGAYAVGALKSATGALASRARRWPGMFRPAGVRAFVDRDRSRDRSQDSNSSNSNSMSLIDQVHQHDRPEHDSRRWRDRARSARFRHRLLFFISLWPSAGRPARGAGPGGPDGPRAPWPPLACVGVVGKGARPAGGSAGRARWIRSPPFAAVAWQSRCCERW